MPENRKIPPAPPRAPAAPPPTPFQGDQLLIQDLRRQLADKDLEISRLRGQVIAYGWQLNPDRMGQ